MTREEVKDLFMMLKSVYPMFDISTDKVNTWYGLMRDMDFKRVMAKAEQHAQSNRFAPTVAEISGYAPTENTHLNKMREWEKEAANVRPEVKNEFKQKMQQLIRGKSK